MVTIYVVTIYGSEQVCDMTCDYFTSQEKAEEYVKEFRLTCEKNKSRYLHINIEEKEVK